MPKAVAQNTNIIALRPVSLTDQADEYGALHDQIAALTKRADALKEALKASGHIVISGTRYIVTNAERPGPERLDTKKAVSTYGRDWLLNAGFLIPGATQKVLSVKPLVQAVSAVAAE